MCVVERGGVVGELVIDFCGSVCACLGPVYTCWQNRHRHYVNGPTAYIFPDPRFPYLMG